MGLPESPFTKCDKYEFNIGTFTLTVGAIYLAHRDQDRFFVHQSVEGDAPPKKDVSMGICDGLGGYAYAQEAAIAACEGIDLSLEYAEVADTEEAAICVMQNAFLNGRKAVLKYGQGGSTTASVGHFIPAKDGLWLSVGHSGDTRIYSATPDGRVVQLTTDHADDAKGHLLTNCLGPSSGINRDRDDFFVHKLVNGERIMLCSDGITGDRSPEPKLSTEMSVEQIYKGMHQDDPLTCARWLISNSIKKDDKTVIVAEVRM